MRRMPPPTQRRNTAYLNRAIWRFGRLDRSLHAPALKPRPDLRLILMARSSGASERTTSALPTWTNCYRDCAAWSKSEDRTDLHSEGFVRSNGWVERRARRGLNLAFYGRRVRSNEVLERTRLSSPKLIQSLGTTSLADAQLLWHRIEGLSPKLSRRMPPRTQRRNTAYLNRWISRIGQLDHDSDGQAHGVTYLEELLAMIAPLDRRARPSRSSFLIWAF